MSETRVWPGIWGGRAWKISKSNREAFHTFDSEKCSLVSKLFSRLPCINSNNRVFAHSTDCKDKSDWELLTDHATNVGKRATEFANGFDTIGLARLSGILHDLGKVKPKVQARIGGAENIREPHSGEGARYAVENENFGLWGKLIAYCIAGHHAGLANGIDEAARASPTPLCERLRQAERVELPEGLVAPDLQQGTPPPLRGLTDRDPDLNFRLHFFTRMLFSALVDADFLETERFYDEVEGRARERGWAGDLGRLLANLNAYLATLGTEDTDVNRWRQEILGHVRGGAAAAPGLFTLTVPTGGGKTLASLAFALEHAQRHSFDRVIYVIPYMSIVEQTADVFRKALEDDDAVLEHHSSFDWGKIADDETAAERMSLAAQNWDRPVVVTTAVQFFESLYANRPSKCRKLHRLGHSVIILDEAQTLPLRLFRPCLAAIKELARGYGASVVLCTATQPAVIKEDGFGHREGLDKNQVRELAPNPQRLYEALRRVRVNYVGPLDDEDLAARIADTDHVLAIVDNRKHARALFERIRDRPGSYHLTTTMTPSHRREVLSEIRSRLDTGRPVRLVATSLIEAGVDVDFPFVYRAVAGIDSIAQAAGRCNREGRLEEKGQKGRVFVFEPEPTFPPPEDVKQFAQIGLGILKEFDDPLSLEAVREYFSRLLWQMGSAS